MFKKFTAGCVHLVNRYLPDPFIFCIVLTILVFVGAIPATGESPLKIIEVGWGGGLWSLLSFTMQMVLVLVLGNALANAPVVKRLIARIASIAKSPKSAIIVVTFFSLIACWINWGFGLVVGAILAKEIARQVHTVDYRLLIASAYSGFVIWHAGFSGSIPLTVATATPDAGQDASFMVGSYVHEIIPITQTIFSPWNLGIVIIIIITLPFILSMAHPAPEDTITVDPTLLTDDEITFKKPETPAERMEQNAVLSYLMVIAGVIFLVRYFISHGADFNLNIVNTIFLILGIACHKTPLAYVRAIEDASRGAAGIILQFPFYAGIMGMMVFSATNPDGTADLSHSLAGVISEFFVSIANTVTFPLFTFLSAGIVNFFVPSGGGQWAVQGPIMMPAGEEIGVDPALTSMGIAWGDAWTNMIQPFWALPALGIAGLSARDIMGYCIITLLLSGIVVCGGFIIIGLM